MSWTGLRHSVPVIRVSKNGALIDQPPQPAFIEGVEAGKIVISHLIQRQNED